MAKLLVIGGSGFFGKSILDFFHRGGLERWGIERVVAMSRNVERLKLEIPQLVAGNVDLYSDDISTAERLPDADIVIHAAASTDASRYLSQPQKERRNIQAGTFNYCTLAQRFHAGSKILYVSSGAVYGNQPLSMKAIPEDYVVDNPANISDGKRDYAYAKRDAEKAIMRLGGQGLSVGIARCFAFVGPWLPRDRHFAVGNFIGDGLCGRPITVKARHQVYRSYMYADDLVEWLMTIACHASPQCPTYNVGSDQEILLGDLAKLVAGEFRLPVHVPPISEEEIDRYVPSVDRARRELGLSLRYDLPSAIRATVSAIRNRGWCGA